MAGLHVLLHVDVRLHLVSVVVEVLVYSLLARCVVLALSKLLSWTLGVHAHLVVQHRLVLAVLDTQLLALAAHHLKLSVVSP